MSAATADHLSRLRTLFVRAYRTATGTHEHLALPIAEAFLAQLRRELGGQEIRIPAESAAERYQTIRDAHALGASVQEICAMVQVDRATVYRALRRPAREVR